MSCSCSNSTANKTMLKIMTITMVVFFLFVSGTHAQEVPSCAQKLVPCADYLNGTVTPSTECCNGIKEAVNNELTCLCSLYKAPGLLQTLGVNVSQALQLTSRCGVSSDLSACSKAEAPATPTPPQGVPGNDGNRMMAWSGISSLILLLVSSLFT